MRKFYLFCLFGYGVFLQRVDTSDKPCLFHNHIWNSLSIFFGSYREQREYEEMKPGRRFNYLRAPMYHRVEVDRPIWRLCFHGREYNRRTTLSAIRVGPFRRPIHPNCRCTILSPNDQKNDV